MIEQKDPKSVDYIGYFYCQCRIALVKMKKNKIRKLINYYLFFSIKGRVYHFFLSFLLKKKEKIFFTYLNCHFIVFSYLSLSRIFDDNI